MKNSIGRYSYLWEQFKFRWHLERQSIPADLHLHLFDKHLLLHRHFLKPWPLEKDDALAILLDVFFVAETTKIFINGSEHTENWFLEQCWRGVPLLFPSL